MLTSVRVARRSSILPYGFKLKHIWVWCYVGCRVRERDNDFEFMFSQLLWSEEVNDRYVLMRTAWT